MIQRLQILAETVLGYFCRREILAGAHDVLIVDSTTIRLDEISIRNILLRIDPLCATSEEGGVCVPALDVAAAILDRDRPIHAGIPNQIAPAPRGDARALRRLQIHAAEQARANDEATLLLQVPDVIGRWITIRHSHAVALLDRLPYAA